jgi:lipopolysaccharide/colanic/teichoic acid biosynthesis glycosyltransferase
MASRPIDLVFASVAAAVAAPICLLAAVGIWLSDGRPILYKSRRVGRDGRLFTMYKLRTMRVTPAGSRITATGDERVFALGKWLRASKIDELPQLLNVFRGDMAIIGPRPEDPEIVVAWYGDLARETLTVRPGLASPGSIFNFTHGERLLETDDPESAYVRELLPRKLALDLIYVRRASVAYDARVMFRAALAIFCRVIGRRRFAEPPEMAEANGLQALLHATSNASAFSSPS